jgi:predicted permease
MSLLDAVRYRISALLHPTRHARDLQREMEFHIDLEAAQHQHDAHGTLSKHDARFAARRQFGNVTYLTEDARRMTALQSLDNVERDLRYAVRTFRREPGFTLGVVLTLALGIGANTAMFALIDRILFRPPPHLIAPARVHRIYAGETIRGQEHIGGVGEYARYADLTRWTSSFDRVAGFSEWDLAVGIGDASREMRIGVVSASFFDFFDVPPSLGRYFGPSEDIPGKGAHVAVASYALWQSAYGGRTDILGAKVQIGSDLYEIIGVSGPGFVGLWPNQTPAYFVPIATFGDVQARTELPPTETSWWTTYHWSWMDMIARSKPGISEERLNADLTQALVKSVDAERLESSSIPATALLRPRGIAASILSERGPKASGFAKVAAWLAGVAFIVLIIACANVANLLLARALRRRREIALRLALGVSRYGLLAQLMTENALLVVAGALAGLLVAQWGSLGLRLAFIPTARALSVFGDQRTLIFGVGAALATGLLTGLAPIVQATRANLTADLKSGAREGVHQPSRLRAALLVVQATLSVVLLVGAGLFVRSLSHVRGVRLGYDVDPLLMVELNMRGVKLDSAGAVDLRRRLLERARSTPAVASASLETGTPFWSSEREALFIAGVDTVARLGRFDISAVSPEYFATFGTRIVRGRGILAMDGANAPLVMVVSQKMASTIWPRHEALGKCVRIGADTSPCRTVVGVAEDIKSHQLSEDPDMYYYVPAAQYHSERTGIFVRMAGDAGAFTEGVRRSLQHEMPSPAYVTVTPFAEIVGEQVRSWKLGAAMFSAFGLLALVLAAIGLYSVIAYTVAERTHEMGVRMALGAQRREVVKLVVLGGARFAFAGVAIGGAIAFAATPWIAPLLFDESPRDPAVYAIVGAALIVVSFAASWLPAHRAARVDPMQALRYE